MTLIGWQGFEYDGMTGSGAAIWQRWFFNTRGTGSPRTGSYALELSDSGDIRTARFASIASDDHATFIAGGAFQQGFNRAQILCAFYGDRNGDVGVFNVAAPGTLHVYLYRTTTGVIEVYRGDGTLLGATGAGVLPYPSGYKYIEAKVTLHNSTGSVVVNVDETEVLSITGVDTRNGGTEAVLDGVNWHAGNYIGGGTVTYWDDLYVCNGAGTEHNDFLGAVRIDTLRPDGNGNSSDWDGSDGNSTNNYLLVDDATLAGDTDYVASATVGDKDTYAFANTAFPSTENVLAVGVNVTANKQDAGAADLDLIARLSGTEDAQPIDWPLLNGTDKVSSVLFTEKPGGGTWSVSDVNSAEFGFEHT